MSYSVTIANKHKDGSLYNRGTWTMITDLRELLELLQLDEQVTCRELMKLFKSDLPVRKWDHYQPPKGAGALRLSILLGDITGENPIYSVDRCISEISANKIESFTKHGNILINKMGGYQWFDPAYHVMVNKMPSVPEDKLKGLYNIPEGTKFLNLENDPELEDYVKTRLGHMDTNFSHITSLRDFSDEELLEKMKVFVDKGGWMLYIYTTGQDIAQMHKYTDLAFEAGIESYEFIMTVDINMDHYLVFDKLKQEGCSVTYKLSKE